jgi:hypothetical protein
MIAWAVSSIRGRVIASVVRRVDSLVVRCLFTRSCSDNLSSSQILREDRATTTCYTCCLGMCNQFYTLQRLYTFPMNRDYPLIVEYSLYRRAPIHNSEVCARKSLQGCSMVSSSLQRTHRRFHRQCEHCTYPEGPPLVPYGFQL